MLHNPLQQPIPDAPDLQKLFPIGKAAQPCSDIQDPLGKGLPNSLHRAKIVCLGGVKICIQNMGSGFHLRTSSRSCPSGLCCHDGGGSGQAGLGGQHIGLDLGRFTWTAKGVEQAKATARSQHTNHHRFRQTPHTGTPFPHISPCFAFIIAYFPVLCKVLANKYSIFYFSAGGSEDSKSF